MSETINENVQNDIRILIIDDDKVNPALAKGLLQRHGCTVEIASSPMRALEKFARDPHCVDIVLLDYFMPTLDGGQTVQHLRKLNPDIKVVLFSGAEEMHLRQIMKQNPIDAYVHKPLRIDEALAVIRKLVGTPSAQTMTARA
jgi:two-component system, cell cycle sensor histidine kinase and response regulator CckA